ncbi:MAG: TAXI family TRAP transporter solute-binding subunit [Hamadaea sp.]|nr:TAXI family TRAP transporter solute-binding subunit [Hamadaea sp.]
MRTRAARTVAALTIVATVLTACAKPHVDPRTRLWHGGQLTIGTGPTNGVFNQLGGGYADIVNRHMSGFEAVAVPTNGAKENLQRLVRGDVDIALTYSDVAGEAVAGTGEFAGTPIGVKALARMFTAYTHLLVRKDAGIDTLADLKGRRVGTGPAGSGTDIVATRILTAAGIDPGKQVVKQSMSLSQMTTAFQAGRLDAFFYTAGLPTVGLTAMMAQMPGAFRLLPTDAVFPALQKAYPGAYTVETITKEAYGLPDVKTVAVPALLVADADVPDDVAEQLTRLLFEHQDELAAVHAEGRNIRREFASQTDPVQLHPGARRYYGV